MTNYDIRSRLIAPCAKIEPDTGEAYFDLSNFVLRLILFEKYILQSNGFREFKDIINVFGYDGIMQILSSNVLQIQSEFYAVGQTGQTGLGFRGKKRDGSPKELLPLNSYSFDIIKHADYKTIVHKNLQRINEIGNLHVKQASKLKRTIAGKLVKFPADSTNEILKQLRNDLKSNVPIIKSALAVKLEEKLNTKINKSDFNINIEEPDEGDFHAESNISKIYSLNDIEAHEVVGSALLAVGSLNKTIETMRAFSALSGFTYKGLNIFEKKLNFLEEKISPEYQEGRLRRILSLSGFPDLDEAIKEGKLKVEKLMKIRESSECREFRQWLWSIDSYTNEELKKRIESFKGKLSSFIRRKSGKAIRWLVTSGLGSIPGAGLVLGPSASLIDNFLLEKLLPNPGAITFISKMYPPIFKKE